MSDTQQTRTVVVVAADMIFSARIRAATTAARMRALFPRNADQLTQAAPEADLIILDLDTRWLDAATAIRALKQGPASPPIVAFVSHVRTDLIEAARQAGADRVLARSAFVNMLPEILAGR